ncbi:glycosyltransferase [Halopiger goleimassiliensis]|uniref:glycosyltransferase n=1 Tax=Halopiger goleimassiliensis TaxID=1293048 RepID=UPI001E300B55|nr:glycosyltransferase family 2 protein [Halopiger goleimassiliensis]
MVSSRYAVELLGTTCITGALLGFGVLAGLGVWTVTVTLGLVTVRLVFLIGMVTVIGFALFAVLSGGLLSRGVWADRSTQERLASGPAVCAIVPAYRDGNVLDISVESLLENAYEPLTVAIVVEPDDEPTRKRAEELAAEYDRVDCLVNGTPGSKATAINYAVQQSDAEYFAVVDADERVAPEFVPAAAAALENGADVFQGRRIPRPNGAVETIAYCERIIVHSAYALFEMFGFANPKSASVVFTREAFEKIGGYRSMLTEDIAFAHECHDANLTVHQDRRCTSTMEAPHTLGDLWGQRKRWRIGQIQVLHSRLRQELRGGTGFRGVLSLARAVGSLVGGMLTLVVASHVLLLLLFEATLTLLVPFLCILATIGAVWLRDLTAGRVGRLSWTVVLVPFVYPALGVLTVKSLLEYYCTWDGEWYQVMKVGT